MINDPNDPREGLDNNFILPKVKNKMDKRKVSHLSGATAS